MLKAGKKILIDGAIEIYMARRSDLSGPVEYGDHFADFGQIIHEIDSIENYSKMISKLEDGSFSNLGFFPDDSDMLSQFTKDLMRLARLI